MGKDICVMWYQLHGKNWITSIPVNFVTKAIELKLVDWDSFFDYLSEA